MKQHIHLYVGGKFRKTIVCSAFWLDSSGVHTILGYTPFAAEARANDVKCQIVLSKNDSVLVEYVATI